MKIVAHNRRGMVNKIPFGATGSNFPFIPLKDLHLNIKVIKSLPKGAASKLKTKGGYLCDAIAA